MKTKEELNAIKNEVEALNKKLAELSEDELKQVSGGILPDETDYLILNETIRHRVAAQTYQKDIGSDKNAKVIFN